MTKPDSKLAKALQTARERDRDWRMNELPQAHQAALLHVLEALGLKPLKPRDLVFVCPLCGNETASIRQKLDTWLCIGCMEGGPTKDLPRLLAGKPPKPERHLAQSYQRLYPPVGNALEFTKALVDRGVLEEGEPRR